MYLDNTSTKYFLSNINASTKYCKNESSVKSKTVSPVHTVSVCMLFGLARLLVCGRYKHRFYNYSTSVHIKLPFLHLLNFFCNFHRFIIFTRKIYCIARFIITRKNFFKK